MCGTKPCGPCAAKQKALNESATRKRVVINENDLKITPAAKAQLIKQTKVALDAIYNIYNLAENHKVIKPKLLDNIDESFEHLQEALNLLVIQEPNK